MFAAGRNLSLGDQQFSYMHSQCFPFLISFIMEAKPKQEIEKENTL